MGTPRFLFQATQTINLDFIYLFIGYLVAYGVPMPGIRSELQLQPMLQLQQRWILQPTVPGWESNLCPGIAETPMIPLHYSRNSLTWIFNFKKIKDLKKKKKPEIFIQIQFGIYHHLDLAGKEIYFPVLPPLLPLHFSNDLSITQICMEEGNPQSLWHIG